MDFRCLNAWIKKDSYPLPRIQEVLESMAGAATLLHDGFQEWILVGPHGPRVAFTLGNLGFYEFTRMPFRLCNIPVTFQCLMQNTLGELNLTYCIIYLDDVIIFGWMEEEHLKCLCVVFEHF